MFYTRFIFRNQLIFIYLVERVTAKHSPKKLYKKTPHQTLIFRYIHRYCVTFTKYIRTFKKKNKKQNHKVYNRKSGSDSLFNIDFPIVAKHLENNLETNFSSNIIESELFNENKQVSNIVNIQKK